jgi:ABC-2 type transport system permease protein
MVVISDGDIIRNEIRRSGTALMPVTLGLDRYTMQTFGNSDFIVNCLNYLVDDNELMKLRSREMKLRLLDKGIIRKNRALIQLINTILPVLLVICAGILYEIIRKRIFAR